MSGGEGHSKASARERGKTGFTAEAVQTENGDWAIKLTSESGKDLRISNDSASAVGSVSLADIAVLDGDTSTASKESTP